MVGLTEEEELYVKNDKHDLTIQEGDSYVSTTRYATPIYTELNGITYRLDDNSGLDDIRSNRT